MNLLRISLWTPLLIIVVLAAAGVYLLSALAPSEEPWQLPIAAAPNLKADPGMPCTDSSPFRNAYFGDLHVHTAYSWDGSGRGMDTTPDQAYRFARGEAIGLPPYSSDGKGRRTAQLERPLDFAAVTDHAEAIGEVNLCITPGSSQFDSEACRAFRGEDNYGLLPKVMSPMAAIMGSTRSEEMCGSDGAACREATLASWQIMQAAAEQWQDRSGDCNFTTFHGYEYTWAPWANRVHRNVIFRNEVVPELPVSSVDETSPEGLWQRLKALCTDTDGDCDVLTIPHNPNHSSGRMFPLSDPAQTLKERRARARLAADMEPLVEMMQIKGESECRNGLWGVTGAPDEFCDIEKWVPLEGQKDCEAGTGLGKSLGRGCVSRNDYARYAIAAGLLEEKDLDVNPYQLGFIGSSDTHNGTPGDVEEWDWQGSIGLSDATPGKRLTPPIQRNPGGLVGVWAEENSRDSLFDALRRREVFATSGTRMTMRFFAGWEDFSSGDGNPNSWCARRDALQAAYESGVSMGAELHGGSGNSPFFAISALSDPGTEEHPGGLLQRLQVIKVQALEDGSFHQKVFDVAGGDNNASVDLNTCTPQGAGATQLCTVWQDPEFNHEQSAAYYTRVIENPSCRWTTWTCMNMSEADRPAICEELKPTTQERAWSSPIWYRPQE